MEHGNCTQLYCLRLLYMSTAKLIHLCGSLTMGRNNTYQFFCRLFHSILSCPSIALTQWCALCVSFSPAREHAIKLGEKRNSTMALQPPTGDTHAIRNGTSQTFQQPICYLGSETHSYCTLSGRWEDVMSRSETDRNNQSGCRWKSFEGHLKVWPAV